MVAAYGAAPASASQSPESASASAGSPHIARIGVVAPLNSGLTKFGRGIRNSAQLAVDQANARHVLNGWRFVLDARDDSSDPATGQAAARALARDPKTIGVVGTYNSGVAAKVAPVLASKGIVMVSPANTDATLTLGPDPAHPVRPWANYFRLVAPDSVQGPFLAGSAYDDLGVRRVSIVTETKSVSKGLADSFAAAFTSRGGTVLSEHVVPDATTDFTQVVQSIIGEHPDLLFFGGEYDSAAMLAKQAVAGGIAVPLMGGDGIKDDAFITGAGAASEGDYASTVGAPLASLPSAAAYAEAYQRAGFTDPPSDYGVYAYDATNLIIAAAKQVLTGGNRVDRQVRDAIVAAVQNADTTGASGPISFDAFGDTRHKVFTLYRVVNGAWTAVKTAVVP